MKKYILFILSFILGMGCAWSGIILDTKVLVHFNIFLSDSVVMFFIPILLLILAIIYFRWKKKGFVPIIGLILGFFMSFLLVYVGIGLGECLLSQACILPFQ